MHEGDSSHAAVLMSSQLSLLAPKERVEGINGVLNTNVALNAGISSTLLYTTYPTYPTALCCSNGAALAVVVAAKDNFRIYIWFITSKSQGY